MIKAKIKSPLKILSSSVILSAVTLVGCNENSIDNAELRQLIADAGLSGDPSAGRVLPSINDAKAQLGKRLFFTKGLGGDDDSACVTCHHPVLGGGDDLSLPIGVGAEAPDLLGPGRLHSATAVGGHYDGGPTVPRNAPTTFNIGLWDQVLFHDGRVESLGKTPGVNGDDGSGIRTPDSAFGVADANSGDNLAAAQSRFPVTSHEEMRGFTNFVGDNAAVRSAIELKLRTVWNAEFMAAYGNSMISYERIAESIGEYERSQVFVDTPWKAYVEGDDAAISDSAKLGAMLFFKGRDEGGADCASCHSGDFFSDEGFHVVAMPQIGRGKGDDNGTLTNDDFGRARETGQASDRYKFRTPSLLNVEETGPWGHAGAYTSLEATVRHHLNPAQAVANFDFSQLTQAGLQVDDMLTNTQFALDQLEANRAANVPAVLKDVSLNSLQVNALVDFLKALTDPCVQNASCLAKWAPDASDADPDGLQLKAVDVDGNLL